MGIMVYSIYIYILHYYGNYGIFLIMGYAGFVSSTVPLQGKLRVPTPRNLTPGPGHYFKESGAIYV